MDLEKVLLISLQSSASVTSLFVISGRDFDPSLFSEQVGVSPTKVWHRTLEALKDRQDIPELEWRYQLDRRLHSSLDEAIREVLDPFVPFRERIRNFIYKYKCNSYVFCRIHGDSARIELCAEAETIELLASLRWHSAFRSTCDFGPDKGSGTESTVVRHFFEELRGQIP